MNQSRAFRWGLLVVAAVFLLAVPHVFGEYPQTLATEILIYGLFAMSIDILAGYAGRTSLGHGAIFGAAGYVTAYCVVTLGSDPWMAMLLGVLASVVVAAIFGALAVRTSGVYFLLLTLALGMVVWGVTYRWTSVTGAENGLRGVARPDVLTDLDTYYYFVLAVVAAMVAIIYRFVHSPFGQALQGIKESESRMRTLGYNVPLMLAVGFTLSGLFAGVAGVLIVFLNNFVSPNSVSLALSTQGLLMAILGGVGTLWGSFIGSAVIILLQNVVSFYTERWMTILGLLFVLTMLFAPEGLLGKGRALSRRWLKKSSPES
jgi:branched-chain amino acid transport system permease protein